MVFSRGICTLKCVFQSKLCRRFFEVYGKLLRFSHTHKQIQVKRQCLKTKLLQEPHVFVYLLSEFKTSLNSYWFFVSCRAINSNLRLLRYIYDHCCWTSIYNFLQCEQQQIKKFFTFLFCEHTRSQSEISDLLKCITIFGFARADEFITQISNSSIDSDK